MMTLAEASSYFDRTQVLDAYSGLPLFLAQIDPYDDSKRDAMVAYRRILSVAPGVTIPAHRTISVFGAIWLVAGEPEIDGLEEQHRVKYVLQMALGQWKIGSITEFLAGAAPAGVFAFPGWSKDSKETAESSDVTNNFEVLLPFGTPVAPQQIIWANDAAYLAMSVRTLPSEFVGVTAVRLDQMAPAAADVQSRVYSPAEGAYTLGALQTVAALRVRWQSLFSYDSQMEARNQEGDFTLVLPLGTAVSTSSRITFGGDAHTVLGVNQLAGGVAVHARKA